MDNQNEYKRAKKIVENKLQFYIHMAVFVIINIFLFILNLLTSPGSLWFYWATFGWGIGLFFHGVKVFFFSDFSAFKEKMIEEEMMKGQGN